MFDRYFYKGTAHNTAKAFQDSPFVVQGQPQPNDLLYWFGSQHQPEGHAAIMGNHGYIYENSTIHSGTVTGGKGMRVFREMRKPDLIVRLRPRVL
jgi:hypothetical protein